MANSDNPWEPPLAGTEVEHLVGALDRLRTTFRWKADDLDAAGLRTRIGARLRPAGVVIVVTIAASSVLVAYQAVTRLIHPHRASDLVAVAAAALAGFAGNELVARYRMGVGPKDWLRGAVRRWAARQG